MSLNLKLSPREAMDAFYALAGPAINAGRIGAETVNRLVNCGDRDRELCQAVA